MSTRAQLKALDQHFAEQNRDRIMRIRVQPPWRVTYRYEGDRPGMEYVHGEANPRELVGWMSRQFTEGVIVMRVWEAL